MGDNHDTYEVAIVGAGPAGSAAAIYLARLGAHVVLVDRAAFPRDKPCAEYLSPACEPLLRELGVLDEVEATAPARLRGFRIYTPNGASFRGDFAGTRDANGHALFETGFAIPRMRLDAALVNAARRAGVEVREGWRLAQITRGEDGISSLTPTTGSPLTTQIVLAADGVHSTIARRLRLHATGSLRKIALVAHMRGIAGLDDYGEVHVAGRRYVGLAPLEPMPHADLCNVAMVVDEARDGHALAGRPEAFLLSTLETFPRLRGRLAGATVVRPTLTTSRVCVRARRVVGDGLMLIGDAAGYYDPFTGEGIFHALESARLATTTAASGLANGDFTASALAPYARASRIAFRGKRTIERIIQAAVQVPPLMDHLAAVMTRHPGMADTVVAVTGDYLSPAAVLRPGYLLRLVL
jgi:flavin-dependent dehydrogenase